jgi:hypothetical protein
MEPAVTIASLSQASVPGAEQACTAIAVMACADFVAPLLGGPPPMVTPERMELYIHQGAAVYGAWRRSKAPGNEAYAYAKEIVDLVSPAVPICIGEEHGDALDDASSTLGEALQLLSTPDSAAVLTVGALSMALLKGGTELFDSHPQLEYNDCAVHIRFESRDGLFAYLLTRFGFAGNAGVEFSCCVIRKRLHHAPTAYPKQELALKKADTLPPGFFYVFARDIQKGTGSKEYIVAGLQDFYDHYSKLKPAFRTHYDMVRDGWPVTFYMDLEFESFLENRHCDRRKMLEAMIRHVAMQWAEERGVEMDAIMPGFVVTDSSNMPELEGEYPQAMDLEQDKGKEEEEEELTKVSFHVHNQFMWFAGGVSALGEFMQRVVDLGNTMLCVWRKKNGKMVKECFADMAVYTRNRCFRLMLSTKIGSSRPFVPFDVTAAAVTEMVSRNFFFRMILSPPAVELYKLHCEPAVSAHASRALSSSSGTKKVFALGKAPLPIAVLAKAVEQHYKPKRMLGFNVAPTGLVTFPMIKHDCEICEDEHNNQCYAVADLKTRTFYSKCHADRTKSGPEVPFPESLGPLSLVNEAELTEDGYFPAGSSTSRTVLGFAAALYESARRTAPSIPLSADVFYDGTEYEVKLAQACAHDQGALVLYISFNKLVIRCKGKNCSAEGKRWERPSHSSKSAGLWNLSFLFPASVGGALKQVAPSPGSSLDPAVGFPSFGMSAAAFLAQTDLLGALGFNHQVPVSQSAYANRLKQLEDWCLERNSTAAAVQHKVRLMRMILLDELMEACYRECLAVAPDFVYPIQLLPSEGPSTLALALWIHLAQRRGYKLDRDGKFYIPTCDDAGRRFYQSVPMSQVMASTCTFDVVPNLCTTVFWKENSLKELKRRLTNYFPSLLVEKRYVGCSDAVYDLKIYKPLTWEEAEATVLPFMFVNRTLSQVSNAERINWGFESARP